MESSHESVELQPLSSQDTIRTHHSNAVEIDSKDILKDILPNMVTSVTEPDNETFIYFTSDSDGYFSCPNENCSRR